MKTTLLFTLAAMGVALAGDPAPSIDKSPIAAAPAAPSIYHWFAGGTAGYLIDNEEAFFSGHLGVDMPYQLGGWNTATYLEVAYFELSDCVAEFDDNGQNGQVARGIDGPDQRLRTCVDIEVIPITLNYKLERPINDSLNVYCGAGAGVALIDLEASRGAERASDDDIVFFAQAFAGLLYQVNPSFELYAGGRLIWFDDPEFTIDGSKVTFDDLDRFGFDFSEFDGIVEAGGRINF